MSPFSYDRDFWALIGPDAELIDAPCSNDREHVREKYRELGFLNTGTVFRSIWTGKPNCRVIEFNPETRTLCDVTDDWFEETFAEELAEERRPYTRAEEEGNRADREWSEA